MNKQRLERLEHTIKAQEPPGKMYVSVRDEAELEELMATHPERLRGKKIYVGISPDDWDTERSETLGGLDKR